MQRPIAHIKAIQISQRVFMRLLQLYPHAYRQEYGPHMAQLFKDCSLEAVGQGGTTALLELWISTFFDVAKTAFEEHYKEFFTMSKEKAIGRAGWGLLGGSLLLAVFASSSLETSFMDPLDRPDAAIEYFKLVSGTLGMLGLAAGAWFLRNAYGHLAGNLGKLALFGSALAAVVGAGIMLGMSLQPANPDGSWWGLALLSLVISATGFGFLGLASLQNKVLPGLNWLLTFSLAIPLALAAQIGVSSQLGTWLWAAGLLSIAAAGVWILRSTVTVKAGR